MSSRNTRGVGRALFVGVQACERIRHAVESRLLSIGIEGAKEKILSANALQPQRRLFQKLGNIVKSVGFHRLVPVHFAGDKALCLRRKAGFYDRILENFDMVVGAATIFGVFQMQVGLKRAGKLCFESHVVKDPSSGRASQNDLSEKA